MQQVRLVAIVLIQGRLYYYRTSFISCLIDIRVERLLSAFGFALLNPELCVTALFDLLVVYHLANLHVNSIMH